MRKILFLLSAVVLSAALLMPSTAWARTVADDGFVVGKKIDTRYFALMLAPDVDAGALVQTLNIGPGHKILAGQSLTGATFAADNLGDLLDALFTWSCGVLDMQLYNYRGNVKVVRDAAQLQDVFRKLYGHASGSDKAFYIYEINTLYISADAFTKEILGHEIAHTITSNFFVVQPPAKVAEVLSGYIEYQLRKK